MIQRPEQEWVFRNHWNTAQHGMKQGRGHQSEEEGSQLGTREGLDRPSLYL